MDGTDLSPLHNHSEWSAGMTWMTLSSAVFSSAVAICSANSPDTRSSSTVGNSPYEEPADADLVIDTSVLSRSEATAAVLSLLTSGGWLSANEP